MIKVNDKHKKIDLTSLTLNGVKRKIISAGGISLMVLTLSGCHIDRKDIQEPKEEISLEHQEENEKIVYNIPKYSKDETIKIDNIYAVTSDDERVINNNTYTYEDLEHITGFVLLVKDDDNYDFLNYMPNLETLIITDESKTYKFNNIDGSRFKKSMSINIKSFSEDITFSESRYPFLKDIPHIETLTIGSKEKAMNIDSTYLESLKNIDNLDLGISVISNLHYKDLTHLKSLSLNGKPYDIAMYFNNKDLNKLEDANVDIRTDDMSTLRMVNNEIDEIVKSLNLSDDAKEQEKLNAILEYVLENYTYDEEVSELLANNERDKIDHSKFYEKGEMMGAFESDTQICGNYAAVTTALSHSLGLDTYLMLSNNHAWNAIRIGDYYYYVDPTWIDGKDTYIPDKEATMLDENGKVTMKTYSFKVQPIEYLFQEGNQEEIDKLSWYLEDPTEIVDSSKESHKPRYMPEGLVIREIPDEIEPTKHIKQDISKKKYEIILNNKKFIIGGAALIGILSGIGVAVAIKKKKEERMERYRLYRNPHINYTNINYNPYDNTYSKSKSR
ncbi:MAG: hypothetical protein IJ565_05345 [Bacilli bacterium]|nr:hypothetical protein [Bacilli bacterium]